MRTNEEKIERVKAVMQQLRAEAHQLCMKAGDAAFAGDLDAEWAFNQAAGSLERLAKLIEEAIE